MRPAGRRGRFDLLVELEGPDLDQRSALAVTIRRPAIDDGDYHWRAAAHDEIESGAGARATP
jgi:hypothetical protein